MDQYVIRRNGNHVWIISWWDIVGSKVYCDVSNTTKNYYFLQFQTVLKELISLVYVSTQWAAVIAVRALISVAPQNEIPLAKGIYIAP